LLSPHAAANFPPETQQIVRGAFADALHVVFIAALVIVVLGVITIALMPGGSAVAIRDAAFGVVDEPLLPDGETVLLGPPATLREADRAP
jgi:hypothetical protein